jgi:hypothetical protein
VYRPNGTGVQPRMQKGAPPVYNPHKPAATAQRMVAARPPAPAFPRFNTIQRGHDRKSTAFTPLDLQNAAFSTVTAMLYIDADGDGSWECYGKFTSDTNGHAEAHILQYLTDEVHFSGDAHAVIELTASPCGPQDKNCAHSLMHFVNFIAEDRGIAKVTIKALGFYKGSTESMDSATQILSTTGMHFEVWDVRAEMLNGSAPEGYDNSLTLQNFAQAEIFQEPKAGRKTSPLDKSTFNQEKFGNYLWS